MKSQWSKRFLSANSMFLGILAVLTFFFPKLSTIIAIVAIMLGICALVKIGTHPKHFEAPAMAVLGLTFAVVAILYASTSIPLVQDIYGGTIPLVPIYEPELACSPGTLLVGMFCCEDEDYNGICDIDDLILEEKTELESEEEPNIEPELIIEPIDLTTEQTTVEEVIDLPEEIVDTETVEVIEEEPTTIELLTLEQAELIDNSKFATTNALSGQKSQYGEVGDTLVFLVRINNDYANDDNHEHYYKVRVASKQAGVWIQNADSVEKENNFFGNYELTSEEYLDIPIVMEIGNYDSEGERTTEKAYEYRVDITDAWSEDRDYDEYEDSFTLYVNVQ
jgi:hypothetical protein